MILRNSSPMQTAVKVLPSGCVATKCPGRTGLALAPIVKKMTKVAIKRLILMSVLCVINKSFVYLRTELQI